MGHEKVGRVSSSFGGALDLLTPLWHHPFACLLPARKQHSVLEGGCGESLWALPGSLPLRAFTCPSFATWHRCELLCPRGRLLQPLRAPLPPLLRRHLGEARWASVHGDPQPSAFVSGIVCFIFMNCFPIPPSRPQGAQGVLRGPLLMPPSQRPCEVALPTPACPMAHISSASLGCQRLL